MHKHCILQDKSHHLITASTLKINYYHYYQSDHRITSLQPPECHIFKTKDAQTLPRQS